MCNCTRILLKTWLCFISCKEKYIVAEERSFLKGRIFGSCAFCSTIAAKYRSSSRGAFFKGRNCADRARLGCTLHTRPSAAGVIEMGETAVHVVTFLWDQKGKFWPAMEWAVNTFLTHGEILITTGILPAEFQYRRWMSGSFDHMKMRKINKTFKALNLANLYRPLSDEITKSMISKRLETTGGWTPFIKKYIQLPLSFHDFKSNPLG